MAGRVVAKFAALKLDIIFAHHKSQHALASGALVHRTFKNRIMEAARLMLLTLLPHPKIGRLRVDGFPVS